ncbi:hypothetical protein J5N97_005550 [Dioscorea zingiberensis]|uniref:Uncharacterized protein n=1 Tax=Dioscorea zingiberensis TaxID=325984 RepID=A0A9D5D974_9LILI|nr:hypothetical protein J5N97_005550 [Dioscorea zingiberensis]
MRSGMKAIMAELSSVSLSTLRSSSFGSMATSVSSVSSASLVEASYDFFIDSCGGGGDGDRFVSEKQQRGETSLDIDLEMEEMKKPTANAS